MINFYKLVGFLSEYDLSLSMIESSYHSTERAANQPWIMSTNILGLIIKRIFRYYY